MFASDWPMCLQRVDYACWVGTVKELAASLSTDESEAFFSKTAQTAYALPVKPTATEDAV